MFPLFEQRLTEFGVPVFNFQIKVQGLVRVIDGERRPGPLTRPYLLVTGVGEPKQVARTAALSMGQPPREQLIFPDHHPFTRKDVRAIEQFAAKQHCAHVLCTPKDAVKLGPLARENFWTFDLDVDFGPAWRGNGREGARFDAWFDARFDAIRAGMPKATPSPRNKPETKPKTSDRAKESR